MQRDDRDLLDVLKFELKFLQDGGYGKSPRTPRRPLLIFEDSPTCMNFNCQRHSPCDDCVLIDLVPPEFRSAQLPCRHIPFRESGETLDSLYQHSDQAEIEDALERWLRATIQRLEDQRAGAQQARDLIASSGGVLKGMPLYPKPGEGPQTFDRTVSLHPKCANPACPTAFHWTGGGKFFRFRPAPEAATTASSTDSPRGTHGLRHYWLCERCSQMFTLVYDDECGVVLKALWPISQPSEERKESAVAALG